MKRNEKNESWTGPAFTISVQYFNISLLKNVVVTKADLLLNKSTKTIMAGLIPLKA